MEESVRFAKHWQYEKIGDVIAASSEMQSVEKNYQNRIIFQRQIFPDIFMNAIFEGHNGVDVSQDLYDFFKDCRWDAGFEQMINDYSHDGKGEFEITIKDMMKALDSQFYKKNMKVLCDWVADWHKKTIEGIAGDVQKISQQCVYLMNTTMSKENLLAVLQEYTKSIDEALTSFDGEQKKQHKETCYGLILAVRQSYENLRKISDDFFKDLDKEFRDFCMDVCTKTDLFDAAYITINTLFNRFTFVHDQMFDFNFRTSADSEKTWKEMQQIFDDKGIEFKQETFASDKFAKTDQFPIDFLTLAKKKIKIEADKDAPIQQTREFKSQVRGLEEQKDPSVALKSLLEFNKACLDKIGVVTILGNSTTIKFQGATALFTLFNQTNNTVINISIGNSLTVIKTSSRAIKMNNEPDFNDEKEKQRVKNMPRYFHVQEAYSNKLWTRDTHLKYFDISTEYSRAFGDFNYKITRDVSFEDWCDDKKIQLFQQLGVTIDAEFSVAKLGKDAQALVMGSHCVWKQNTPLSIMKITDFFYFQPKQGNILSLENIKSEKDEYSYGTTEHYATDSFSIDRCNRITCSNMQKNQRTEDLSELDVTKINNKQRLILCLAHLQNWVYVDEDNIFVVCVDLRLISQNSKDAVTVILHEAQEIKKDTCNFVIDEKSCERMITVKPRSLSEDVKNMIKMANIQIEPPCFDVWIGSKGEFSKRPKNNDLVKKPQDRMNFSRIVGILLWVVIIAVIIFAVAFFLR